MQTNISYSNYQIWKIQSEFPTVNLPWAELATKY